jgi:hypothetical protein
MGVASLRAIACVVVLILPFGCGYNPTNPPYTPPSSSTLSGTVILDGRMDSAFTALGGTRVALEGVEHYTVSLPNGSYRIDSVPPGVYTAIFSHPEYDSVAVQNLAILPPTGLTLLPTRLDQRLNASSPLRLDSAGVQGADLWLYGRVNDNWMTYFVLYFNHSPTVSANSGEHVVAYERSLITDSDPAYLQIAASALRTPALEADVHFRSGDSVFVVAYTFRGTRFARDSHELERMNLRNKSNVLGFVMP